MCTWSRSCWSSPGEAGWRSSPRALRAVIARHDIFRTSVAWEGLPEPVQVVWRQAELPVTEVTLAAGDDQAAAAGLAAAAGERMDLGRAPLLRVYAAADAGRRWPVAGLVQVHHLLLDHTGLEVVLEEIPALLSGRGRRTAAGAAAVPGVRGPGPAGRAARRA